MAIKKDLLNSDFSNYRDEEFETLERYVEHIEDHRDTPEFETLKRVWPIMPIGSVIHFGSLSFKDSPSVTQMLQDALGISNLKVQRFNFATKHAYLVKE